MQRIERVSRSPKVAYQPLFKRQGWDLREAGFRRIRWLGASAFAALVLLGVWLATHHHSEQASSNAQSVVEISRAFTASQELVDALPSAAVGPLSDELDRVNRDLARTAEFLLATLP